MCPATYKERERVINSTIEAERWGELGRIGQTPATKHRVGASYRVHEDTVMLYGKTYRAVVVDSSAHDKRRQRCLERELAASLKEVKAAASERMAQSTAYHQLKVSVQERPRYGRGRPQQDAPRTLVALAYGLKAEVVEKTGVLAKRRQQAGRFVLLSNVPGQAPGGYSAARILRTDKEQHGIEKNFGFLKEDQIVNALFLKLAERIEALGLILLISLLISRLLEHAMRTHLEEGNTMVPGWENKPTRRPTAYMVTWKFKGVLVLCVGQQRYLAKPLSAVQEAFLDALQVPQSFTHCPRTG